jgi:putative flippase GtrA
MRLPAGGLAAPLDRQTIGQLLRYGLSGSAAALAQLAILALLVELAATPPVLASVTAFAGATVINYTLQHRFVFGRSSGHGWYFPRYVAVTLLTMGLNTLLFWFLTEAVGIYYLVSQLITIGLIVPVNFLANRNFTFAVNRPKSGGERPQPTGVARARRQCLPPLRLSRGPGVQVPVRSSEAPVGARSPRPWR